MSIDTDFMGELRAAMNLKPSKASGLLLWTITALITFLVLWASFSEIEELTRGTGQVVPSSEMQIVQSLEGGILAELSVTEGDRVTKGQILMRISDINFASEEGGAEAQFLSLQAKKIRLQAEISGEELAALDELAEKVPDIVANEKALYESRQAELNNAKAILDSRIEKAQAEIDQTKAEIKRFKESQSLLYQELKITSEMVKQKAVPKIEEIRLRREISETSGNLESRTERLEGLNAELRVAEGERLDQENRFRSQALGELGEVETRIAQLEQSMKSIEDRVYRTDLRAPVDGIVNDIAIKTIGGVIEPAQKLIEIVPVNEKLKIKARVLPNEIAFLKPGQLVNVKITAYDPQRYGSLKGELARIGANSINDRDGNIYFEIEVSTEKNHLGTEEAPLPITPGMVAEVEVITGKRTIMDYMLKPILRARDRALTER